MPTVKHYFRESVGIGFALARTVPNSRFPAKQPPLGVLLYHPFGDIASVIFIFLPVAAGAFRPPAWHGSC